MKFFLRTSQSDEEDLFEPIRELRSPLSMESIKALVFERGAIGISIWNHLWSVLVEFLALSVVAGLVWNSLPDVHSAKPAIRNVSSTPLHSFQSVTMQESPPPPMPFHPANKSINIPAVQVHEATPEFEKTPNVEVRSNAVTYSRTKYSDENFSSITASSLDDPSGHPWYAMVSSGAVFSHLRMFGEEAEIGIHNGWETFGIAFTNASGTRDEHDILSHKTSASSILFSERDQMIALLAGANFSIGPISGNAELGPALLFSSTNFMDAATGAIGPITATRQFGAAAEVSAFYNLNDFLQAGVTGISSIQSKQVTSGILVSITVRP